MPCIHKSGFLFQQNCNFLIKEISDNFLTDSADQELDTSLKERESIITYNCTVVYMSQCLSWNKCKQNCESMGATSYR